MLINLFKIFIAHFRDELVHKSSAHSKLLVVYKTASVV
jgi:hypothetical protein